MDKKDLANTIVFEENPYQAEQPEEVQLFTLEGVPTED